MVRMKIVMIYDQIQSGLGAKDDKMVPLTLLKEPVGPAVMMEQYLRAHDQRVLATLCCGNGTYMADPDEVARKLVAMVGKLSPDFVMCGPAFNYAEYAEMCGRVAADIEAAGKVHALAAMSEENAETIERYKGLVPIVRTPKKGGIGLNESLKAMCDLADAIATGGDAAALKSQFCF